MIADLNGDRKMDLLVANERSTNASVFLGDGHRTFSPAAGYQYLPARRMMWLWAISIVMTDPIWPSRIMRLNSSRSCSAMAAGALRQPRFPRDRRL